MDVPFFKPYISEDDVENVNEVLASGWLTSGEWVERFEQLFSHYIGVRYCVAVGSATAALHLSLLTSRAKPGDYVLVPTMTFASTAEIVYHCRCHPLLVDCKLDDLTIDIHDAERKLLRARKEGKKVSCIIPVHYAGKMVDMDLVEDLAEAYDLDVIEDAAHCCGSSYFSRKSGKSFRKSPKSLAQCYSFYCNKCITTCGEGGMIATDVEEIAKKVCVLSLHGLSESAFKRFSATGNVFYDIECLGFKYNLTDVAAAMGCAQVKKADFLKSKRSEAVSLYRELLKDNPYIRLLNDGLDSGEHSHHIFVVRYISSCDASLLSRTQLLQMLRHKGIVCSVHWKPLHMYSFYKKQGFREEDFPNATRAFGEILSLPLFPEIEQEQILYVVKSLNELLNVS